MKTIIIYASSHHGNTKKIVDAMAQAVNADIIDITKATNPDISEYDIIGFASGIYFNSFHKKIKEYIENTHFDTNKKFFLAYTCGMRYCDYSKNIKKILLGKGIKNISDFYCRGYDTFGIFGKIGGIAKKHPTNKDLTKAKNFILNIVNLNTKI